MIAFAIHVVLPFFAVYSLPQVNNSLLTQVANNSSSIQTLIQSKSVPSKKKFVVCTQHGFMLLASADIEITVDEKKTFYPKPNPAFKCPLCYASAYGFKDLVFINFFEFSKFFTHSNFKKIYSLHFLVMEFSLLQVPHIRAPPT
ncbi:MAG: hypothetical protein V4629_04465 [Pseudomonadota bacterium]